MSAVRIRKSWAVVSLLWVGLIFFCCTDMADRMCRTALERCETWLFGPDNGPDTGEHSDHFWAEKSVHVMLFVTLAFLLTRTYDGDTRTVAVATVVTGTFIGTASEAFQTLFPTRDPAMRDVLINASCTVVGSWVFLRARFRQRLRSRSANAGAGS